MIKIKENSLDLSGHWFTFCVKPGVDIKLKIRPYLAEIGVCIKKKTNISKKRFDKRYFEFTLDYLLEDFRGVGIDENIPLEPTFEGKKKVIGSIGLKIAEFIFDTAVELGKERINQIIEVTKEDFKNGEHR